MKRGDYITCPTCNGKGKVYDHTAGIMTFGLKLSEIFKITQKR